MTLKELLHTLYILESSLNESNGELDEQIEHSLELTNLALTEKVDAYAVILDRCASLEAEYESKAELFKRVAKGFDRVQKSIKDRLALSSKQLGSDIVGNDWRFKCSPTKGRLVVDCEAHDLPKEFQILEAKPNNASIRTALESGIDIAGCKIEQGISVRKYPNRKELK